MDLKRDPGRSGTKDVTLRREPVAALGAAAPQQRASLSGAHAATEAVLALASAVVWLIRTLHNEVSLVGEVAVNPWGSRNASILGRSSGKSTVLGKPAKTQSASRKTE